MENSLERALTVHQTSMGSTRLPLELQQHVFSFLDTRSFYAARNVCKWWRFASVDAVTLAKQLRKLPILPPGEASKSSLKELHNLFNEAAYRLLLAIHIHRQPDIPGNRNFSVGPRVTAASNGNRTVTINDRQIALFDEDGKVIAQRPLNDLKETVGNGPWLRVTPTSYHEMALSASGRLLAIAQERTIQIYDLEAENDSFTVNEYISSAAGHYICGLDFEQNDHVLRVRLSGKGTTLYLGSPREGHVQADMDHWKGKTGLKHVFLDSSLLTISSTDSQGDHIARISGLQLLRPFADGFLFAGQKHGGNESSHYVLGHIKCSTAVHIHVLFTEPQNVTVLARLASYLSAWHYTLNGVHEAGTGLWENMPSAHEHHPNFALSPEATVLVLAERDKKRVRPMPLFQLFLYRLPGRQGMLRTLEEAGRKKEGRWATLSEFLDRVESDGRPGNQRAEGGQQQQNAAETPTKRHTVARIPICLSTVQGVVEDMQWETVEHEGKPATMLSVRTAEMTRKWRLSDI
jgi:hypothetical protein